MYFRWHFCELRNMGYELTRFQGDVDEELICPICSGVLEEPLQVCLSQFILTVSLQFYKLNISSVYLNFCMIYNRDYYNCMKFEDLFCFAVIY